MTHRSSSLLLLVATLATTACATSGGAPAPSPTGERVIATMADGTTLRQAVGDPATHVRFAAPLARVASAVQASYADIGIEANAADPATGRYGVTSYRFPRRLGGAPIASLFSCGSNLSGAAVDQGRVTGDVLTTLTARPDGTTDAAILVTGTLRRSDGASADQLSCTSTGRFEEMLRAAIAKRLAAP